MNNDLFKQWGMGAFLGYDVFCCYGSDNVIEGALIIETIGEVGKFDSDFEACRQAEKDGIKFINDIEGLEKGLYIDTKENRKICLQALKESNKYHIDNLIFNSVKEGNLGYWKRYFKHFD